MRDVFGNDATPLAAKELYIFDLDGTIYLDGTLFDGALEMLERIRAKGSHYVFATNNSSRSTKQYVERLRSIGIDVDEPEVVSSTQAVAKLVAAEHPHELIYVQGVTAFVEELRELGLNVCTDAHAGATVVLVGFDRELTTTKLEDTTWLLSCGKGSKGEPIPYYASHPDLVCPTAWGAVPDLGWICQGLEYATGRVPVVAGKPEPLMIELACERFGVAPEACVFVGDRLYTDIATGVAAGIDTVCVLTGEASLDDLRTSSVQPGWVLKSVADIARILADA